HRTVKASVGKVLNAPDIFLVSANAVAMREGETQTLTIKVRDKDAGIDPTTFPSLQIMPITNLANMSQYVTITKVMPTGNNEFTILLTLDLTDAELTKNLDHFGFTLKAMTRFGQVSSDKKVLVDVYTSF